MRFRLPFDDVQYAAAAKTHAQMRANLRKVRRNFAPHSRQETALLREYRNVIQEFGRELIKPADRISPATLDSLNDRAVQAFVVYLETYSARK